MTVWKPVERRLVERLGDPEVGDLDLAVGVHHDVLGLEIAVDDAVRLRVRQCREHVLEHVGDLGECELPHVAAAATRLDVLHRDVGHVLALEVVVHRDDVRVVE